MSLWCAAIGAPLACAPAHPASPNGAGGDVRIDVHEPEDSAVMEYRLQAPEHAVPFQARLVRAVQDPARRPFDALIWQQVDSEQEGVLWILHLECLPPKGSLESPGGAAPPELRLQGLHIADLQHAWTLPEGRVASMLAPEPGWQANRDSQASAGEDSSRPHVYHPLQVLLAPATPALNPGQSVSIALLGPQDWQEPVLSAGQAQFPFVPQTQRESVPLRDQPLLKL